MPRPIKDRKVCRMPHTFDFFPAEGTGGETAVLLSVDEYETIRLIDGEGLSQEECSDRMEIARTTVQKIYESARKKLAQMLVEGRPLRIAGGAYRLCDGQGTGCGAEKCFKRDIMKEFTRRKGEMIMRIAVTYENGEIFQHFGHTEAFKVYDVAEGKVVATEVVSTNGSGHGALAEVLSAIGADVLICGGIGGGARIALAYAGIRLFGGVSGNADAAVEALLAGALEYDPDVRCNHHGEHHHHQEGGCGSHGCGGHNCGHH